MHTKRNHNTSLKFFLKLSKTLFLSLVACIFDLAQFLNSHHIIHQSRARFLLEGYRSSMIQTFSSVPTMIYKYFLSQSVCASIHSLSSLYSANDCTLPVAIDWLNDLAVQLKAIIVPQNAPRETENPIQVVKLLC